MYPSLGTPDIEHWVNFQPNEQFPFENFFKRAINCPVTWANMNEPSTQRTNWGYYCSIYDVRYATIDEFLWELLIIVARMTSHGNDSAE